MPSRTSAISTNSVITSAVKNSEMAAAATIAIDMDSSMVIRFATRFSRASLKMGQPPTNKPATPITLMARKRLPQAPPDGRRRHGHQCDAEHLLPLKGVVVLSVGVVVMGR